MKVLVQWATDPAQDWEEIDSRDWINLPKQPGPPLDRSPIFVETPDDPLYKQKVIGFSDGFSIDRRKGWIYRVLVQGMTFSDDHISVRQKSDHIEVAAWRDDPGDYGEENYFASVWRLHEVKDNTEQYVTFYCHPSLKDRYKIRTTGGLAIVRNFEEFRSPPEQYVRHGIWMTNKQLENLDKAAQPRGWEEWRGDAV